MNGLMSAKPSPVAARLAVAATTLLLLQLFSVLQVPAVTGALRLTSWIIGLVASAAFGFALFGRWPPEPRTWSDRDEG